MYVGVWIRMGVLLCCLSACGGGPDKTVADGGAAKAPEPDAGARGDRMAQMRARVQDKPVPVAVVEVQRGQVNAYYASTTSLSAEEEAVVVAKTQGVVEKIFVEEGQVVKAGTPLAQLDTRKLELEVARTKTNIESFERAYARSKQLFDSKMISPDAFDQSRYNLEREQASLALQMYDLAEATIRAPIAGTVTVRYIKLGKSLSPNNQAFEIKRNDSLEAILNVPEKELVKLKEGQEAVVRVDALDRRAFPGIVSRVAPEVDPASGTFRVTVLLTNKDRLLKPGMFVRVDIRYDARENALLVTRDAVVTQRDESTVFVVRDGTAARQVVQLGYSMGQEVEILTGLDAGDKVVTTGQGGLKDGAPVRIVNL